MLLVPALGALRASFPNSGLVILLGGCLISSVLYCCSKNLKGWMGQCYSSVLLSSKEKYILMAWGQANPKDSKRREAPSSILAPLFICFFLLPLILLYANWASQEGCLFYPRLSLWSSNLPLFYFRGLFPSLSFSHCHYGLFSLF